MWGVSLLLLSKAAVGVFVALTLKRVEIELGDLILAMEAEEKICFWLLTTAGKMSALSGVACLFISYLKQFEYSKNSSSHHPQ